MENVTFDEFNIKKNRVTVDEILEVIESDLSIAENLVPSERGNVRVMIIGWTFSGRILEIGIEYIADTEHVFHAMNAGKRYKKDFLRRLNYDF